MNNVVPLHSRSKINPFPQQSKLYFDVYERPLQFVGSTDAYDVQSHKAIVRMIDDKPKAIGIVGAKYNMIKTKEVCQSVEEVFMQKMTQDELDGCTVKDEIAYSGGTCIRQYVFPKVQTQVNDNSTVGFRVVIVNGYDGSSSFKLYAGAIDFFCSNGMVTGSFDLTVKKHTSGFQIPALVERVRQNIDIFYKQAEQWKHWAGRTITEQEARTVYEQMPNVSPRRVEQLMRQFFIECKTHGSTVWALYSAATYYATHNEGEFALRQTSLDHAAVTMLNREQQVRSWVSGESFARLVS